MKNKVAIIGYGQTKFKLHENLTFSDLIFEATEKAIADAEISIDDVETVIDAGVDLLDGKAISNTEIISAAGCFLKEESKVEEDGLTALYYAYLRILSGYHKIALVFGYSKSTTVNLDAYSTCLAEPVIQRRLGLNETTALALQAQAYKEKYRVSDEDAAKVIEKNYAQAAPNENYELEKEIKKEDVLKSEIVSSPLKKFDLPAFKDGACALVLAREDLARDKNPLWIEGTANCVDGYDIGLRKVEEITSLKMAAEKAYQMAGIKNPLSEIDIFEISSPTSYHELMIYETLGLAKAGQGKNLLENSHQLNPSGGSLPAYVYVAEGLNRLIECTQALRKGKAKTGLAHGTSGLAMQSNTVLILEK